VQSFNSISSGLTVESFFVFVFDDKCVELPLAMGLIVQAKKYEATFISLNNQPELET